MTAQEFLSAFPQISAATDGVQQLRGLVLQMAISGRLIRRAPSDAFALSRPLANPMGRGLSAQNSHSDGQQVLPSVGSAGGPWPLPDGWQWSTLGKRTNYGNAPKHEFSDVQETTWVLELEDIEKGTSRLLRRVRASERHFRSTKNGFPKGAVLYGKLRPYLDKVVVADEDGVCSTEIIPISVFPGIDAKYLRWYLKSPYFVAFASGSTHGMNLPRLGTEAARQAWLPVPPIRVQEEVTARVDELMLLCDRLEAMQDLRRQRCAVVRLAVFEALANAPAPKDLECSWKRVLLSVRHIFDGPESVNSVRTAILDLAMAGRLSSPLSRGSTGTSLLEEIEQRRAVWAKTIDGQARKELRTMEKKLRAQQAAIPDADLPENWTWGTLTQIAQAVVDCHNKTAPYVDKGIHLVRTTDIRDGRIDLTHTRKVSAETYAFWSRRMPPVAGDVLFTREAPMGEAAIVPENETVCLGQRTMLIRLFPDLFNNRFLLYAIYSSGFQRRMLGAAVGMTVKHLRVGDVEELVVPIPPKAEQDRLAVLIDRLFAHCDRMARQMSERQQLSCLLAKSSVEAITGIRLEQATEMKTPKIELVSNVHLNHAPSDGEFAPLAVLLTRSTGKMAAKELWQRYGGEIDSFYQQLKIEIGREWIAVPEIAEVLEVEVP